MFKPPFLNNFPFLAVICSGILYGLSFSPFIHSQLDFLAWFCWLPLFIALKNQSLKPGYYALAVYLTFLIGNLIAVWWLFVSASVVFISLAEVFGFSLPPSLVFIPFYFVQKKIGWQRALYLLPLLWTCWEWLLTQQEWHSTLTFFYHTQVNYPWLIQFCDMTGAWGISFWLITCNVLLAKTWIAWQEQAQSYFRLFSKTVIVILSLLLLPLSYSAFCFMQWQDKLGTSERIKVALFQANQIYNANPKPDEIKLLENKIIFSTGLLIRQQPDLLIWSEDSVDTDFTQFPELEKYLFTVVKRWNTPLLFGFKERINQDNLYNSAILITPQLASYALQQNKPTELPLKIYHKQDLLPFAEYVPYSKVFPSLREWTLTFYGEKTYFQPGTDEGFVFAFLSKDGVIHRTGIRICYEVMYLSDTVKMIRNGAQMLALISNDELFAKTPESYRMMGYTRLIAITMRRSVARDANTGLSFFVDPLGRVYGQIPWWQTGDSVASVSLNDDLSFYVRYPDFFPKACGLLLPFLIFWAANSTLSTRNVL